MKEKTRKNWIDALRCLAMLFVLYGHLIPSVKVFFIFTSPVKIPLFFAITGYLFNHTQPDFAAFVAKLFRKLILPWLFLSIVPLLCVVPIKGISYFLEQVGFILLGKTIWYMPCCVIAELVHYCLTKYSRNTLALSVSSLICALAGFVMGEMNLLDYAMLNRALVAQSFLLIGHYVHTYEDELFSLSNTKLGALIALYLALCIFSLYAFPGECLDVHLNKYYSPLLCSVLISTGCVSLFILFERLSSFPHWSLFIGRNTLIYYIWGGYAQGLAVKIALILGLPMINEPFSALFGILLICLLCGIASMTVNRFAPFLFGNAVHQCVGHQ